MSINNQGNRKRTAFIFIPDQSQTCGTKSIQNKTKIEEFDSLCVLSLLLGFWLEVTTLKHGVVTKTLCQVKSIDEIGRTILVLGEYESTFIIDLKTVTNVIALDM
ncbi:hypothetical protein [Neobacillus cucumis]|uniref:hypothetical protein n=1 Tax=Neobacillus cucumis TaxID=1740721 RepID=UPI0019661C64|nr:hypothetical protein [Neobacillus cucumis]MBM7654569.1 hypothetical protein [Neobacillus cucumis]